MSKEESPDAARKRQQFDDFVNGSGNSRDDGQAATPIVWHLPPPISADEWQRARLAPRCIVDNYLYADVACHIAPGGTGKTTMQLYEAVHVSLGLPLWGLQVVTPGPVLVISAEDRREFLVARLREICKALKLPDKLLHLVRERVRIDDRTASLRKLTLVVDDVVLASNFATEIVQACRTSNFLPVLICFDPMVSFGVGERRVNDAEQGLVEAARVISAGLDCCTRYTHHTGKAPARDKAGDQYAGRGGSSLPDGARMVSVMQSLNDAEVQRLCGARLAAGQSAFALMRPKLSYCPPQPVPIYVRRNAGAFEVLVPPQQPDDASKREAAGMKLHEWLAGELHEGRRHTAHTVESERPCGMLRADARAALAWLSVRGLVESAELPGKRPQRGARTYLHPSPTAATGEANGEATA